MTGRSIQAQLAEMGSSLPDAQRRVADLVVSDPEAVAFGTVQAIAERVGVSTPTVIRLAGQLGFDGYGGLRDALRAELSQRLRSAAERVGVSHGGPLLDRALEVERANVEGTIARLDETVIDEVVDLLSDTERSVTVMSNSSMVGIASHFADDLALCRGRVQFVDGNEFRLATVLSACRPDDVIVTFDVQRHEAALIRLQRQAVSHGAIPVAITDRLPCSFDLTGGHALTFSSQTANLFESQVGPMVVANLLVTGVVERRRNRIATRIRRLEDLWTGSGLFAD